MSVNSRLIDGNMGLLGFDRRLQIIRTCRAQSL
nr:MAG TPA: hypothetical protein [Bacteriophage sp.]